MVLLSDLVIKGFSGNSSGKVLLDGVKKH